jgi:predicted MPP superfamily phosphohydrolase
LVTCVKELQPDAIFLPGDLTNSYTYFDEVRLAKLAKALSAVAPCYAVAGNHELRLGREPRYGAILARNGVHYLCDSYADWTRGGDTIRLFGAAYKRPAPLEINAQPAIVLAHKPDRFHYYCNARWNLVVCGHAHGGQVRLGKRSLYAPGQGFLPTYTDGIYNAQDTVMVVSRGLGNSSIPWRVSNRPHLPLLILQPK